MSTKGIYLPSGKFLPFSGTGHEIATRASALGGMWTNGWLPNPDPILRQMGQDVAAYQDLRADAAVAGGLRRRRAAVRAMESGLTRGQASARFFGLVEQAIKALPLPALISDVLSAAEQGYCVLEVTWSVKDGARLPVSVTGKPSSWFKFRAADNAPLFLSRSHPQGLELPPRKFLVVTQEGDYNNPYGLADLSLCFWPAAFRRGGGKFWARFTEKYGTPFLVGKLPPSVGL